MLSLKQLSTLKVTLDRRVDDTFINYCLYSLNKTVHFHRIVLCLMQNVLVPVPCSRSSPPFVAGRDPLQASAGQPERRKQPADEEQLLHFLQEQSEDILVQNKWDDLELYQSLQGAAQTLFMKSFYLGEMKILQTCFHLLKNALMPKGWSTRIQA